MDEVFEVVGVNVFMDSEIQITLSSDSGTLVFNVDSDKGWNIGRKYRVRVTRSLGKEDES